MPNPAPVATLPVKSDGAVAAGCGVEAARLTYGRCPRGEITPAPNLALCLWQSRGRKTFPSIAQVFHLATTTSVLSAVSQVRQMLVRDPTMRAQLESITFYLDSD